MYVYPRIRDLREDHDLTQQAVALALGTQRRQYCRWENGEYEIPSHIIVQLAKLYDTTTDYLLDGGHPTKAP